MATSIDTAPDTAASAWTVGGQLVRMRALRAAELPQLLELTAAEGWPYWVDNFRPYLHTVPPTFYGVFTDDQLLIGHCAGYTVTADVGCIGAFLVHKAHRGQGIGKHLISQVMDVLGDRHIFLEAEVPQEIVQMYERRGFHKLGLELWRATVQVDASLESAAQQALTEGVTVQQLGQANDQLQTQVEEYRRTLCETDNWAQLMQCLLIDDVTTLVAINNANDVAGYAAFHIQEDSTFFNIHIRGFYADNLSFAKAIFYKFLSAFAASTKKLRVVTSYMSTNHGQVAALFEGVRCGQMVVNKELGTRMVRPMKDKNIADSWEKLNVDWQKVFSFTQAWADVV